MDLLRDILPIIECILTIIFIGYVVLDWLFN